MDQLGGGFKHPNHYFQLRSKDPAKPTTKVMKLKIGDRVSRGVAENSKKLTDIVSRLPKELQGDPNLTLEGFTPGEGDVSTLDRVTIKDSHGQSKIVVLVSGDQATSADWEVSEIQVGAMKAPLYTPRKSWKHLWNKMPKALRWASVLVLPLLFTATATTVRFLSQKSQASKAALQLNKILAGQKMRGMEDFSAAIDRQVESLSGATLTEEQTGYLQQARERAAALAKPDVDLDALAEEWIPYESGDGSLIPAGYHDELGHFRPVFYQLISEGDTYELIQFEVSGAEDGIPSTSRWELPAGVEVGYLLRELLALSQASTTTQPEDKSKLQEMRRAYREMVPQTSKKATAQPKATTAVGRDRIDALLNRHGGEMRESGQGVIGDGFDLFGAALSYGVDDDARQQVLLQQSLNGMERCLRLAEDGIGKLDAADRRAVMDELRARQSKLQSRLQETIGSSKDSWQPLFDDYSARVQNIGAKVAKSTSTKQKGAAFEIKHIKAVGKAAKSKTQAAPDPLLEYSQGLSGFSAVLEAKEVVAATEQVEVLAKTIDRLVDAGRYAEALTLSQAVQSMIPIPVVSESTEEVSRDFWEAIYNAPGTSEEKLQILARWNTALDKVTHCQGESSFRLHRRAAGAEEVLHLLNGRAVLSKIAKIKAKLILDGLKDKVDPLVFQQLQSPQFFQNLAEIPEEIKSNVTREQLAALFFALCDPDYEQARDLLQYHPVYSSGMTAEASKRAKAVLDYLNPESQLRQADPFYPNKQAYTVRFDAFVEVREQQGPNGSGYHAGTDISALQVLRNIAGQYGIVTKKGGSDLAQGWEEMGAPDERGQMSGDKTPEALALTRHMVWSQIVIRPDFSVAKSFSDSEFGLLKAVTWFTNLQEQSREEVGADLDRLQEVMISRAYEQVSSDVDQVRGRLDLRPDRYVIEGKPVIRIGGRSAGVHYVPWGLALPEPFASQFSPSPDDTSGADLAGVPVSRLRSHLGKKTGETLAPSSVHSREPGKGAAAYAVQDVTTGTEAAILQLCRTLEGVDALDEYLLSTLQIGGPIMGRLERYNSALIECLHLMVSRSDLLALPEVRAQLDLLFARPDAIDGLISSEPQAVKAFCEAMKHVVEEQIGTEPTVAAFIMHIGTLIEQHFDSDEEIAFPSYGATYQTKGAEDRKSGVNLLREKFQNHPDIVSQALVEARRFGAISDDQLDSNLEILLQASDALSDPITVLGSPMYLAGSQRWYKTELLPQLQQRLKDDPQKLQRLISSALATAEIEIPEGEWSEIPGRPLSYRQAGGDLVVDLRAGTVMQGGKLVGVKELKVSLPDVIRQQNPRLKNLLGEGEIIARRSKGDVPGQIRYKVECGGKEYTLEHSPTSGDVVLRHQFGDTMYRWADAPGNDRGIAKLAQQTGIWVSEDDSSDCIVLLASLDRWTDSDKLQLKLNTLTGSVRTAIVKGESVVAASERVQAILPVVNPNFLFSLGEDQYLMIDQGVRLKKTSEGYAVADLPGYLMVPVDQQVKTAGGQWHQALGSELCMRFIKDGDEVLYLWPHEVQRTGSGGVTINRSDSLEEASRQPILKIRVDKDGQLQGSAAAFLQMAYVLLMRGDHQRAQFCIERAKREGVDTPDDRAAFVRVKDLLLGAKPGTGKSVATYLKAVLATIDLDRALMEGEEFQPLQAQAYLSRVISMSKAFGRYQAAVDDPVSPLSREPTLQLNEGELERLQSYRRDAMAAMLVDKGKVRGVPQDLLEPLTELPSDLIPMILTHTAAKPDAKALSPTAFSADLVLRNFFFYMNEIQKDLASGIDTKKWEFLFRPLGIGGAVEAEQQGKLQAAQAARQILVQMAFCGLELTPLNMSGEMFVNPSDVAALRSVKGNRATKSEKGTLLRGLAMEVRRRLAQRRYAAYEKKYPAPEYEISIFELPAGSIWDSEGIKENFHKILEGINQLKGIGEDPRRVYKWVLRPLEGSPSKTAQLLRTILVEAMTIRNMARGTGYIEYAYDPEKATVASIPQAHKAVVEMVSDVLQDAMEKMALKLPTVDAKKEEASVVTRQGLKQVSTKRVTGENLVNVKQLSEDPAAFEAIVGKDGLNFSEVERSVFSSAIQEAAGEEEYVDLSILLSAIQGETKVSPIDVRHEQNVGEEVVALEARYGRGGVKQPGLQRTNVPNSSPVPQFLQAATDAIYRATMEATAQADEDRLTNITETLPEQLRGAFDPSQAEGAEKAEMQRVCDSLKSAQARLRRQLELERTLEAAPDKLAALHNTLRIQRGELTGQLKEVRAALVSWMDSDACPFKEIQAMRSQPELYTEADRFAALEDLFQRLDRRIDSTQIVVGGQQMALEQAMTAYLLTKSALQQLPQAMEKLASLEEKAARVKDLAPDSAEYQAFLEESRGFTEILNRRLDLNRYQVEGKLQSPRLYRKILVAENRMGIVARPGQIEALEQLAENPEQWISLRMGEGKTFFIMPVVAELLIEDGHLPVMLVPSQLQTINRVDFDRTTREAFGSRAEPFQPDLDSSPSAAYLAGQYKRLLKLYSEGKYAVTSVDTLASIANLIPRLREDAAKLDGKILSSAKSAGQTIQEYLESDAGNLMFMQRQELHKQVHWLQRMEMLFDGKIEGVSAFFFGDEVDSIFHISKEVNRALGEAVQPDKLIVAQTGTVMSVLWRASEDEDPKLIELAEALQQGTQETFFRKYKKEEYLPLVAAKLLQDPQVHAMLSPEGSLDILSDAVNQEQLVQYLAGIIPTGQSQSVWPDGLPAWDEAIDSDTPQGKQQAAVACLKHIISATLPGLLSTPPRQRVKLTEDDGFQAVPAELGNDTPGSRFGDEYEMVGMQFLAYHQAHLCKAKEGQTEAFFALALVKLQSLAPEQFREISEACGPQPTMAKMAEVLVNTPELWKERGYVLKYAVFGSGLIKRFAEQSSKPVQAVLSGRRAGGVTGTLNEYGLPGYKAGGKQESVTRAVEVETFVRMAANLPQGFETPIETFKDTDSTLVEAKFNQVLGDPQCAAIINEGGYGLEGKSGHEFIAMLRKQNNAVGKNFLYVEGRKAYLWKADSAQPEEVSLKTLRKQKPDWICVFSPEYTRGTDMPIPVGKTYYFPKRSPNAQDMGQSIWRGRGTGDRHTPIVVAPQSSFGTEEVTLGAFLRTVVAGGVSEQVPFNQATEKFRISDIAATAARQAQGEMSKAEMTRELSVESSFVFMQFDSRLHKQLRDYGIVNKSVDFSTDHQAAGKVSTLDQLARQCESEMVRVTQKAKSMGRAAAEVMVALVGGPENAEIKTLFSELREAGVAPLAAMLRMSPEAAEQLEAKLAACVDDEEADQLMGMTYLGETFQKAIQECAFYRGSPDEITFTQALRAETKTQKQCLHEYALGEKDEEIQKVAYAKGVTVEQVKQEIFTFYDPANRMEGESFTDAVQRYVAVVPGVKGAWKMKLPEGTSRLAICAGALWNTLSVAVRGKESQKMRKEVDQAAELSAEDREDLDKLADGIAGLDDLPNRLEEEGNQPVVAALDKYVTAYETLTATVKNPLGKAGPLQQKKSEYQEGSLTAKQHLNNIPAESEIIGSGAGTQETVKQQQQQQQQVTRKVGKVRKGIGKPPPSDDQYDSRWGWWSIDDVDGGRGSQFFTEEVAAADGAFADVYVSKEARKVLELLPALRGAPIFKLGVTNSGKVVVLSKNDYHAKVSNNSDFQRRLKVFAPTHKVDIQLSGETLQDDDHKRNLAVAKFRLGYRCESSDEKKLLQDWYRDLGETKQRAVKTWADKNGVGLSFLTDK